MFYGAEEGDLEIVKLLIQGGTNLSLKDKVWALHGLITDSLILRPSFRNGFRTGLSWVP